MRSGGGGRAGRVRCTFLGRDRGENTAVLYWTVDACGCTCKFSENFVRTGIDARATRTCFKKALPGHGVIYLIQFKFFK